MLGHRFRTRANLVHEARAREIARASFGTDLDRGRPVVVARAPADLMEDVIVVGGGPTGFINALGLAQAFASQSSRPRATSSTRRVRRYISGRFSVVSSASASCKRPRLSAFASRTIRTWSAPAASEFHTRCRYWRATHPALTTCIWASIAWPKLPCTGCRAFRTRQFGSAPDCRDCSRTPRGSRCLSRRRAKQSSCVPGG